MKRRKRTYSIDEFPFIASNQLMKLKKATDELGKLKERPDYQTFFREFKSCPSDFIGISPTPAEGDEPTRPIPKFWSSELSDAFKAFGLNPHIERLLWLIKWPFSDFVKAFDPEGKAQNFSEDLKGIFPHIFSPPSVRVANAGYDASFSYESGNEKVTKLEGPERIIIIDLRHRRQKILKDFDRTLDNLYNRWEIEQKDHHEPFYESSKTFRGWQAKKIGLCPGRTPGEGKLSKDAIKRIRGLSSDIAIFKDKIWPRLRIKGTKKGIAPIESRAELKEAMHEVGFSKLTSRNGTIDFSYKRNDPMRFITKIVQHYLWEIEERKYTLGAIEKQLKDSPSK
ncbi:MAG: hypothetical protein HF981_00455 [Desulfobacteraceae bacterium]|nr:hypothetical protein [Desulfobacteraceae bacterium]MBC2748839.1 hypothetical protein [Desulfobacteraceae bacterium]